MSKKVYNNFVSNYKTLATISQMFNSRTPITKKVILEDTLVDQMTKLPNERQAMRPIDNLTYKMFVQKFNHKYGNSLNEHQKNLLSRYVTLSPENAVEFKLYINDEVGRLKEVVKKLQAKKEVLLDESLGQKNREILGVLENFKTQRINDEMIKTILKMQALAVEA